MSQRAVREKHRNAPQHETGFKQALTWCSEFLPSLTPPSISRNSPSAHKSSSPHLLSSEGVRLVQIVRLHRSKRAIKVQEALWLLTRPGGASVLETYIQGACVRMHFRTEEGGRVHRLDGVCSDDVVQLCLTYKRGREQQGRKTGRERERQLKRSKCLIRIVQAYAGIYETTSSKQVSMCLFFSNTVTRSSP